MSSATEAQALLERLDRTRLNTEIRAIAKEQGKNADLAAHLWKSGGFSARMLSLLILDLKAIDVAYVERMISDIEAVEETEARAPTGEFPPTYRATQSQLLDWLIANVIMKKAALKNETAKWRDDPSPLKQRVFWSVQARSVRAENHDLNEKLLEHIEREMPTASEKVSGT